MTLATLLHSPAVKGAISGIVAAATVDFHAFITWKNFSDLRAYDWNVALFRWAQGAFVGALSGAGYGALVS